MFLRRMILTGDTNLIALSDDDGKHLITVGDLVQYVKDRAG
jgi:hypothetical protein